MKDSPRFASGQSLDPARPAGPPVRGHAAQAEGAERMPVRRRDAATLQVAIRHSWNGATELPRGPSLRLGVEADEALLRVEVDAPFYANPPPPGPVGFHPQLWKHEVVELFLVGHGERYLELELGPHGHYWALLLEGCRQVVDGSRRLQYFASLEGERWRGEARLPLRWLPSGLRHFNAFSIDGQQPERRHWAHAPCPGPGPDFHRLHLFPALPTDFIRACERCLTPTPP